MKVRKTQYVLVAIDVQKGRCRNAGEFTLDTVGIQILGLLD